MRTPSELWNRFNQSTFAWNVAETFGTRIVLIVIGMATNILVARILGPEGRGRFALGMAMTAIGVQFANLGLPSSNTWFVARRPELLGKLLGNSLFISFIVSSVLAIAGWFFYQQFPSLTPLHGWMLILVLASIPFNLAYLLLQNILLGIHEIRFFNKVEIANKSFALIFIFGLVSIKFVTAQVVFLSILFAAMVSVLWMTLHLRSRSTTPITASMEIFKETLPYGFRVYITTFVTFLAGRIDLFLINDLIGVKETGIYSVAFSMADFISLIPIVIGSILFPKISALPNYQERKRITIRAGIVSTSVTYGVMLLFVVLAPYIIRAFFGRQFDDATQIFVWLIVGLIPLPLLNATGQLVSAQGMSYYYAAGWIAGLLFKFIFSYWIITTKSYVYVGIGNAFVSLIVLAFLWKYLRGVNNAQTSHG